jgi:hypothetical protein
VDWNAEGGFRQASAELVEGMRIVDSTPMVAETSKFLGSPANSVLCMHPRATSRALSPGLVESGVCQDHGGEADRRYDMREALPLSQKRHERGNNHKCQRAKGDETRGWKQ